MENIININGRKFQFEILSRTMTRPKSFIDKNHSYISLPVMEVMKIKVTGCVPSDWDGPCNIWHDCELASCYITAWHNVTDEYVEVDVTIFGRTPLYSK